MGVGAGLYMYVVVVQKFTFAISSPDEFLCLQGMKGEKGDQGSIGLPVSIGLPLVHYYNSTLYIIFFCFVSRFLL